MVSEATASGVFLSIGNQDLEMTSVKTAVTNGDGANNARTDWWEFVGRGLTVDPW